MFIYFTYIYMFIYLYTYIYIYVYICIYIQGDWSNYTTQKNIIMYIIFGYSLIKFHLNIVYTLAQYVVYRNVTYFLALGQK